MKKLFFLIPVIFLVGCVWVSDDVVRLSMDVSQVQTETSTNLIKSINEELQEETDVQKRQALIDLRERLDYLKRANNALMKSMTQQKNMEEIAALIREK